MKRPSLMVLAAIITLLAVMPLVSDQSDAADTVYAEPGATIGKTVYTTLTDALNHADKGDTVIITGKAGESYYISNDIRIKAGVTLILPYSDNDRTGHSLGESESKTSAKISGDKYIELVVRDRVTVTVEGSFIIGGITGRPAYFDYQGHTSGSYSQVVLGGNLVLKSGGELHCYGFIKGHGKVVANPNSSVYEPLVILDYIGGDNMVNLYEENQAAFNRYAFINIQCTLRVDSGASFYGYTSLYAKDKYQECNVNIINTYDAMFSLEPKAYATFTYDDTKYLEDTWTSNIWKDIGKMTVTIVGGAKFGTISLNVMDNYIDLNDNYFSIPYNFDYFLEDGIYSINAHYRILPGACITIGENAELDVRKELVLFSGLNDREFEEKYYPLTALLKKYGFRTSGSLIVNGTLVISTGSSLAGIIEGNNEKATIIVEEESEVGV
ncbi:MAG: hypothetical protein MJZ68_08185, partial [archaeon]|nr:hypothetical protein [archaeon]